MRNAAAFILTVCLLALVPAVARPNPQALVRAAGRGDLATAHRLLSQGADPNAGAPPPLIEAAVYDRLAVVKLLLAHGARLEAHDGVGETALTRAAGTSKLSTVKLLVERGANLEATDPQGETPLMITARDGRTHIVQFLLEKGAKVNAQRKDGETALSLAAVKGYTDVVRALLAHHADPAVQDRWGRTALDYARRMRRRGVIELLQRTR